MAMPLEPELNRRDTARSLLKPLFRGNASLHPDEVASLAVAHPPHLQTLA